MVVPLSIQSNNNNMTEHYIMIFRQWDGLFSVCIKGSIYSFQAWIVNEFDVTAEEVGQLMGGN